MQFYVELLAQKHASSRCCYKCDSIDLCKVESIPQMVEKFIPDFPVPIGDQAILDTYIATGELDAYITIIHCKNGYCYTVMF